MNIKVKYHTTTGNTKKVAEAISEAVGVPAESVSENSPFDSVDLLFIGDGVYGGKIDSKTESFIKTLDADKVKNAAVFGTYWRNKEAINIVKELLKKQGINIADESFGCRGKARLFNRRHPDEQDLKAAKEFAKRVVEKARKS